MLKKDFVRKKRRGGKLDPKWVGPYIITAKHSKGFYSLRSNENPVKIIKRVSGAHLKVYHQQQTTPSPHQQSNSSTPQPLLNRQPLHSCPVHPSLHNSTLHSSSPLHQPLLRSPLQQPLHNSPLHHQLHSSSPLNHCMNNSLL